MARVINPWKGASFSPIDKIIILNRVGGSIIVRLTAILLWNISLIDTGTDLIIHRLLPSSDIEHALVYTRTIKNGIAIGR